MSKARTIHKLPSIEDMSEEEYNKMLEESYEQAKKGKGRPANKVLSEIRNEINKNGQIEILASILFKCLCIIGASVSPESIDSRE